MKISCFEFSQVKGRIDKIIYDYTKTIEPLFYELYDKLKEQNYVITDLNKNNYHQLENMFDDDSNYCAILDVPLKRNAKSLLFYSSEKWFLMFFDEEKRYDEKNSQNVSKGITIYRCHNDVDLDCIENSWGFKDTEKFLSGVKLLEIFTDETKHSQKIGKHIVTHKPTLKRLITDYNNDEFKHYYHILSTSRYPYSNGDLNWVNCVITGLLILCARLEIKGVKI